MEVFEGPDPDSARGIEILEGIVQEQVRLYTSSGYIPSEPCMGASDTQKELLALMPPSDPTWEAARTKTRIADRSGLCQKAENAFTHDKVYGVQKLIGSTGSETMIFVSSSHFMATIIRSNGNYGPGLLPC
jgi:hypothetical protein